MGLWQRVHTADQDASLLSAWPLPYPASWVKMVSEAHTEVELQALRLSVKRSRPFGDDGWVAATAERLHLGQTPRPQGRPRHKTNREPRRLQGQLFS